MNADSMDTAGNDGVRAYPFENARFFWYDRPAKGGLMEIFTSSWFTKLPSDIVRVGISRGTPRGMSAGYKRYQKLNPGPWFRSCPSPEVYRQRYFGEVLGRLDPQTVVDELGQIGDRVALLCYEKPDGSNGWCHRALVSAWLSDHLGLVVTEYGRADAGHGWRHPLLHQSLAMAA